MQVERWSNNDLILEKKCVGVNLFLFGFSQLFEAIAVKTKCEVRNGKTNSKDFDNTNTRFLKIHLHVYWLEQFLENIELEIEMKHRNA